MPLPERYAVAVPDVVSLWTGEGYFRTQGEVWLVPCEVRHEEDGQPTGEELEQIRQALVLSPEDVDYLNQPKGHETNKYLRLVQGRLSAKAGNYIHQGMTSFDLLDTALAIQITKSLDIVENDWIKLADTLLLTADKYRSTLQAGRTHGQHAIPQTFGRQVIGWYAETMRGLARTSQAKETIAFGKFSGEIGTNVYFSPDLEGKALAKLGLKPDQAPTQVISRDRHAEVAMLMAVNAGTLGRIAGNLQTLARTEIGEVKEPFDPKSQQGSSSMPHKQNPEISERIMGLSRVTKGAASVILNSMELRDERDISNSSAERFAYQDIFGTLVYATRLMTDVISRARVYPERMLKNLESTNGGIYSPRFLNELLLRDDRPRTEVYDHVRDLVLRAMEGDRHLCELVLEDPKIRSVFTETELTEFFKPDFFLKNIGTAWRRLGLEDSAN